MTFHIMDLVHVSTYIMTWEWGTHIKTCQNRNTWFS